MKKPNKDAVGGPVALTCRSEETGPLRDLLAKIGDKWSILLMVSLSRRPGYRARFSELQRLIDGISQRMLTTTLRQLERDGLLSRHVFAEVPPRVEYELTPLGLSLLEPMRTLVHWIGSNWDVIKEARVGFDHRIR
ncbi:winged helix-turn-helix transcriptional regulator [Granulicella sibirica]|uniref:winged helix-turn-helix transcriptional regulator n=1 Tax=Granulicella sibirica TaxID=2479048 RepID=UPI001008A794|nr:helix-turn-helix domain-containing protein [Granulicella sibirica]